MWNTVIIFIIIIGLVILYNFMPNKSFYSVDNSTLKKVRENFIKLDSSYSNIPLREGSSAYTENKSIITLCLKDPKSGYVYDMNTIMYVALHELAHMCSRTKGHDEEFQKNFTKLLKKATRLGIYNPNIPMPKSYCGVENS